MAHTAQEIPLAQAAQRLSLSWPRAWRLVLEGRISGRKIDGRWQVSSADVERLAQQRREPTGTVVA